MNLLIFLLMMVYFRKQNLMKEFQRNLQIPHKKYLKSYNYIIPISIIIIKMDNWFKVL